jgi:hypothetical protein
MHVGKRISQSAWKQLVVTFRIVTLYAWDSLIFLKDKYGGKWCAGQFVLG